MSALIAMGALAAGQALLGGIAAGDEAKANRIRFEESEFQRRMQGQIENRNIARANSIKWMNNRRIAEAANKTRAENEYWIEYNFSNASGAHGRQTAQLNNHLVNTLYSKNINPNSGTARALLRSVTESSKNKMISMRVNKANQLIGEERKQAQALSSRDFGYNTAVMQMPGSFVGMSPTAAFTTSLAAGVVGGAMDVVGTYAMGDMASKGAG